MWTFKVEGDRVTGEYIVRFYKDGKPYYAGDYFTTDRDDALGTGRAECVRLNKMSENRVSHVPFLEDK